MATWEYMTLMYGTSGKHGRRWIVTPHDMTTEPRQVGQAEKSRFVGKVCQALRLLETALVELDDDGWELVSTSFSGLVFGFYGTAVLRRPATSGGEASAGG